MASIDYNYPDGGEANKDILTKGKDPNWADRRVLDMDTVKGEKGSHGPVSHDTGFKADDGETEKDVKTKEKDHTTSIYKLSSDDIYVQGFMDKFAAANVPTGALELILTNTGIDMTRH